MLVRYWGGPEARIRVKARGRTWYFDGATAFYDVMRVVWGEAYQRTEISPVEEASDAESSSPESEPRSQ